MTQPTIDADPIRSDAPSPPAARGVVAGFGPASYELGLRAAAGATLPR